ncbi:MAG: trypsin-like peptidase domain-containing protein [Pseudobacteriovorax sp.]|nr:trypsin-like peptidase domain-containing protein [Pseudobacteriovorax sp.]
MKRIILGAAALFSFSSTGSAFPDVERTVNFNITNQFTAEYDFTGIVALGNCSGSLVRFDDSLPGDKAMVLTNGHCVRLIDPDTVILDVAARKAFTVLDADARRIGRVNASKLMYATMTKTDFALYELRETFEEIEEKYSVTPLTFSREYPAVGSDIEIISGYWRRGYSCQVEDIVYSLKEADWFFTDSIRYSRPGCDVIGGTSGSPAIDAETRLVIGVNNTINERGRECTINNPCEIDEEGNVFYERGIGYAQQTSWVYTCRDELGAFDISVEGCLLPQP